MATTPLTKVVQHLGKIAFLQQCANLKDEQLLEAFLVQREEFAFKTLVKRHGPMVLGVCRRVLHDHYDAEDAFQATFLVLIRKAATIGNRQQLSNWLYGVAYRTALQSRKALVRRQKRERQVQEMAEEKVDQDDDMRALLPMLDQELSRLPDIYRVPIVLCDLEGNTRKEAAKKLKVPEGTLSTRLTRARALLAKRMARHAKSLAAGTVTLALSQKLTAQSVSSTLVASTVKSATLVAAGKCLGTGAISIKVAALTESVVKAMLLTKLKIALAVLVVVVFLGSGVGAFGRLGRAESQVESKKKNDSEAKREGGQKPAEQPAKEKPPKLVKHSYTDCWVEEVDLTKRTIKLQKQELGAGYPLGGLGGYTLPYTTKHSGGGLGGYGTLGGYSGGLGSLGSGIYAFTLILQVGPATKITFDGKEATLADLKTNRSIKANVDYESEANNEQSPNVYVGKLNRIEVIGTRVGAIVNALDPAGNTITGISDSNAADRWPSLENTWKVASDVRVAINGKEAKFADLKPNMQISLQMSAVNPNVVVITALGPIVVGVVKTVNLQQDTLSVIVKSSHLTAEGVAVAKDAKVVINGTNAKLSDLKAGMRVTLQMSAEMDQSLIVGITVGEAAKSN